MTDAHTAGATTREPPRQARALRTRQKLIDAGIEAFGRFGVDGTNLADDILRPAGVSVGSFYHQFADKTELLLAVLEAGVDARRGLIVEAGIALDNPSLEAMIASGFRRLFESLDAERHAWRIQVREHNNPDPRIHALVLAGRQRWVTLIADALRPWSDADEQALESAATLLMTLATGTANVYLGMPDDHRRQSRAALLESHTQFAVAGLRPIMGASRHTAVPGASELS